MPGEQSASWLANAIYYLVHSDVTTSLLLEIVHREETRHSFSFRDISVPIFRDLLFPFTCAGGEHFIPPREELMHRYAAPPSAAAAAEEDFSL